MITNVTIITMAQLNIMRRPCRFFWFPTLVWTSFALFSSFFFSFLRIFAVWIPSISSPFSRSSELKISTYSDTRIWLFPYLLFPRLFRFFRVCRPFCHHLQKHLPRYFRKTPFYVLKIPIHIHDGRIHSIFKKSKSFLFSILATTLVFDQFNYILRKLVDSLCVVYNNLWLLQSKCVNYYRIQSTLAKVGAIPIIIVPNKRLFLFLVTFSVLLRSSSCLSVSWRNKVHIDCGAINLNSHREGKQITEIISS